MNSVYVFSQILVLISTVFLGITYLVKNKKTVMMLCVIYCVFYASHYLLLGAYTGMIMTTISGFRNAWFYINAKRDVDNSIFTLLLFTIVAIISGIISFQDIFSVVPIIASVISTYSVWQKDTKVYRLLALPVSICFIVYAIHIGSIFSIVIEILLFVVEIIGVIKYNKKENISS